MGHPHLGPKAEQSRKAIVDAAVARYGRDGFRASSIAAIARDAGVSRSLAYAYFENADDLFDAAVDQDVAALIDQVLSPFIREQFDDPFWRQRAIRDLVEALDAFPLAHPVMAGLEPAATGRLLHMPALEQLRLSVAARLSDGQEVGLVRPGVDAALMGRAVITIWVSVLLAAVQFGLDELDDELAPIRLLIESAVLEA